MTYGAKAVAPVEVICGSPRVEFHSKETNDVKLLDLLELLDEKRNKASQRMLHHQRIVERAYKKSISLRTCYEGEWVLRQVFQNTQEINAGKLRPTWEGPYIVDRVVRNGAYKLRDLDGKMLPNAWNVKYLKKYYY